MIPMDILFDTLEPEPRDINLANLKRGGDIITDVSTPNHLIRGGKMTNGGGSQSMANTCQKEAAAHTHSLPDGTRGGLDPTTHARPTNRS